VGDPGRRLGVGVGPLVGDEVEVVLQRGVQARTRLGGLAVTGAQGDGGGRYAGHAEHRRQADGRPLPMTVGAGQQGHAVSSHPSRASAPWIRFGNGPGSTWLETFSGFPRAWENAYLSDTSTWAFGMRASAVSETSAQPTM